MIIISRSNYLYAHDILAFLLFILAILWMKKFSQTFHFKDVDIALTKTLLIKNIPPLLATNDAIRSHFAEAYPDLTVTRVNVAYLVSDLIKKTQELRVVEDTIEAAEDYRVQRGRSLRMYPRSCSLFCGWFCRCCSEKVDVVQFYTEEKAKLEKEVSELTLQSLESPLGFAFVTFDNLNSSKQVFDDYKRSFLSCFQSARSSLRQSSQSAALESDGWKITFATDPEDIRWENLHPTKLSQSIAIVGVDLAMLFVGLFFTTPEVIGEELHAIVRRIAGGHLAELSDGLIDLIDMVLVLIASRL